MSAAHLLSPDLLRRLASLSLAPRQARSGLAGGGHRAMRRGVGLEFAGHRPYFPGEDIRQLDWALLARLDRPFLRTYDEERELTVHLLVDASASMGYGSPSKLTAAATLAAALANVALASHNRVSAVLLGDERARILPASRGLLTEPRLQELLATAKPHGRAGLGSGLGEHARRSRAGLTILLSDLLDPALPAALLGHLEAGHQLALIQLLAKEELSPPEEGDLLLEDSESGETVAVSLDRRQRRAYLERLEGHREDLRRFAQRHGARLYTLRAGDPVERQLVDSLTDGWLLRGR